MLIFGHGYSAAALTPRLLAEGWQVTGTTRSDPDRLVAAGAAPLIWSGDDNGDEDRITEAIARADAILVSIAPDRAGPLAEGPADPVIARFGPALLQARPRWVGYLSSTNVYGDHGGGWVDECTPPDPGMARARARLADLTLRAVTADTDAFARFYGERLGLKPDGPHAFRLGESRIVAAEGPAPARAGWRERGLRYMTVQIFDCDGLTAALERQGVEVGMAPRTIGQVRYSFVRDPDGNWIELSERASLTGKPVREG